MGYRGTKERTTTIRLEGWSTEKALALHLQGRDPAAIASQSLYVAVDLSHMDEEDMYGFARTVLRWATRLEAHALAEIDKAAQRPLF